MSRESALAQGRAFAERGMITQGIVRRKIGTESNDETLVETDQYETIYSGVCEIKGANSVPANGAIPGAIAVSQDAELHFPVDGSGDIRTNDVWECTANPLDPAMVGGKVRIAGMHHATFAVARRFPISENS